MKIVTMITAMTRKMAMLLVSARVVSPGVGHTIAWLTMDGW